MTETYFDGDVFQVLKLDNNEVQHFVFGIKRENKLIISPDDIHSDRVENEIKESEFNTSIEQPYENN